MLPREAFTTVKRRKTKIPLHPPLSASGRGSWVDYLIDINDKEVYSVLDSISKNTYRTFLLHAPSSAYEYSFVIEIFSKTENAILLVPELSQINALYSLLHERFGERLCLLHGALSKGKRSEAIERILSGSSDIVLGTRSAIFAPLKRVSCIAVLHEHSNSYKQQEGLRYSGRDVLLSSPYPSIESFYNCKSGKYTLISPPGSIKKPKVRVVDMKREKLLKPYLSQIVIGASQRHLKENKKVMFLINRRGHSSLLHCNECNYIWECPNCKIPLVFHKQDPSLKCHYCGYSYDIPEKCPRCGGYKVELLGAGTQKVQEDIETILGIKTLRLDSDRARRRSEIERLVRDTFSNDVRIIVGTKFMTRRLGPESGSGSGGYSMAALLNTDLFLNLPDFRSVEKAYQEISYLIEKIEPRGEVFIQTRMPQNYLFKCLKSYDYRSFFHEELSRRKSFHYPPYSRLILIKCISKRSLAEELSGIINKAKKEVDILGPSLSQDARGRRECKVLLKSSIRSRLHSAAKTFIDAFKDSKDVLLRVDVDPISI
jgi:primosomal protein N' (replication factor Y)